jgi:hypothetical protein
VATGTGLAHGRADQFAGLLCILHSFNPDLQDCLTEISSSQMIRECTGLTAGLRRDDYWNHYNTGKM